MKFRELRFYKTLFIIFSFVILFTVSCEKEETPIESPNSKPEIEQIIIGSDSLLVNSSTDLTCKTSDKDGDAISITYFANSGSFKEGNTGESVKYFSSSVTGKDIVTIIVNDGKEKTETEIELYIGDKPQKPILLNPQNHKTEIELSLQLSWKKEPEVTGYDLQVSTDQHFKNFIFSRYGIKQNKYYLTGLNINTIYYWRVRSKNAFGYSVWSQIFSFKTFAPPYAPVIIIPDNNSLNVEVNPLMQWNRVFNARTYSFQFSDKESFESILINKTGLVDTSFQVIGLDYFKNYYWRVSSKNSYGESDWSAVYKFTTTGRDPFSPELLSPSNNQINVPHSIKLIWNRSEYAESYTVQVATDSLFNTIINDSLGISATSYELTNLRNTEKYFWRVKAAN
ncbi:MAG: fibronectin type III domain-containing protein, partial [Ignavibacteria bacterium]|nr:fibronectin type III domain-containing protein [Ignavibacteria bacterium]